MNGQCTCGVYLVEGARFCHKCGRPVDGFEPIAIEEEETSVAPVVATPAPPPLPLPTPAIGFRNGETIRAALISVAITFLPATAGAALSAALLFGGVLVNGLLGVLLYLRRTNRHMTTIEGARQGWICGLFFFAITIVMPLLAVVASGTGALADAIRTQAKAQGGLTPDIAKIIDQPQFLAGFLAALFVIAFVLFTSLASIGGMLGARVFGSGSDTKETGS